MERGRQMRSALLSARRRTTPAPSPARAGRPDLPPPQNRSNPHLADTLEHASALLGRNVAELLDGELEHPLLALLADDLGPDEREVLLGASTLSLDLLENLGRSDADDVRGTGTKAWYRVEGEKCGGARATGRRRVR